MTLMKNFQHCISNKGEICNNEDKCVSVCQMFVYLCMYLCSEETADTELHDLAGRHL